MRSSLAVLGILLVALFAGCKSESQVDESTVAAETVATFAPATTEGTIEPFPETQTTATVVTQTTATTATVTTQPPVKAAPQTKPVTQPAAKPTTTPPATTPPATTTTQAPPAAEPATPPATAPATATTASAPEPATAPATKATTRTPSTKVPKNHTVNREGALHPANTENPVQRCGACHGKDLKGGKAAPSCYSCHEKAVW